MRALGRAAVFLILLCNAAAAELEKMRQIGHRHLPEGLDVIHHENFETMGEWIASNDCLVADGTNGSLSLRTNGTMFWIIGSMDPKYGCMKVFIDGVLVGSVRTTSSGHMSEQLLFASREYGEESHHLEILQVGDRPIGISSVYRLENGGLGMLEMDAERYNVQAGDSLTINVHRVGGSKGQISLALETMSDTAMKDEDFVGVSLNLIFRDGETRKPVAIQTFDSNHDSVVKFVIRLSNPTGGAIIGFNASSFVSVIPRATPAASSSAAPSTNPAVLSGTALSVVLGVCLGMCLAVIIVLIIRRVKYGIVVPQKDLEDLAAMSNERLIRDAPLIIVVDENTR
jgi:hypothetical protein